MLPLSFSFPRTASLPISSSYPHMTRTPYSAAISPNLSHSSPMIFLYNSYLYFHLHPSPPFYPPALDLITSLSHPSLFPFIPHHPPLSLTPYLRTSPTLQTSIHLQTVPFSFSHKTILFAHTPAPSRNKLR